MEDRIDPLIAERAPWLFRARPGTTAVRSVLNHLLGYRKTLVLASAFRDMPAERIMSVMTRMLAQDLKISGLENIPTDGPALVVSNHPTGIADGIIMHKVLAERRPDVYYFANHDILRVLPQMSDMIAPVEWRKDRRSHGKTRETMAFTRRAIENGRLGVIFPSGRLAKRRGLRLHERPWMASAAMLARKFDLPVVPVRLSARNSLLFYSFDALHPTLRDITLFHETLNKHRQHYDVHVGSPIDPATLPRTSEEATEVLKDVVLNLGGHGATLPMFGRPGTNAQQRPVSDTPRRALTGAAASAAR